MDFAKTIHDEIVPATTAVRRRRYYCPVCSAPVSLKRRLVYRPHFAHAKGSGSPDCELYHPGAAIQTPRSTDYLPPTSEETSEPEYRAPLLCIAITGESVDHFTWGLRIWLPRSRTTQGRYQFERRPGQFKVIALAQLAIEDVLVGIRPGLRQYKASFFSGDVDLKYKAAAETPVDGLADNRITVFSTTGYPARLMANGLSWGDTYLFVWKSSLEVSWPEGLAAGVVSENQAWSCSAVTLPSVSTPEIGEWAFENTGLRVAPVRTGCYILPPTGVRIGSAGAVSVPRGTSPLVLFTSPAHDPSAEIHKIEFAGRRQFVEVEANLSPSCLLRLDVPTGRSVLRIDDEDIVEFSSNEREVAEAEIESIELSFDDLQGTVASCPFHSRLARETLQNVRRGYLRLVALSVPAGILGRVSWRGPNDLSWQHREIRTPTPDKEPNSESLLIGQDVIALISQLLADLTADITISFGGFGYVALTAEATPERRLSLPRPIRAGLIWALHQTGRFAGHGTDAAKDDKLLVKMFEESKAPVHLAPHWRALSEQLKNLSINR